MIMLNVGCGAHYHPQWINLDLTPATPDVKRCDLRKGIEFPDCSADVVYHAHVIEHLTPNQAQRLLAECYRVLRPGGVLRVVAPDLEGIAREYLAALDRSQICPAPSQPNAEADLEWMRLELLDQMTRDRPGGEMGRRMRSTDLPNPHFVRKRLGAEFCGPPIRSQAPANHRTRRSLVSSLGRRVSDGRRSLTLAAAFVLGGRKGYTAVREGWFRQSGEIHRWMYDRVSLQRLLEPIGFDQVQPKAYNESVIPGFASFELDQLDGQPRKPDSLYMEGLKR